MQVDLHLVTLYVITPAHGKKRILDKSNSQVVETAFYHLTFGRQADKIQRWRELCSGKQC